MLNEFRVSELAQEFGVHRNTMLNPIKSGAIKAEPGPGLQYIMQKNNYLELCQKFGCKPLFNPDQDFDPEDMQKLSDKLELPTIELKEREKILYGDPLWADIFHFSRDGQVRRCCKGDGQQDKGARPVAVVRYPTKCDWGEYHEGMHSIGMASFLFWM